MIVQRESDIATNHLQRLIQILPDETRAQNRVALDDFLPGLFQQPVVERYRDKAADELNDNRRPDLGAYRL